MIGELLGPYRVERELGTGGMGRVYLARVEEEAPELMVGEKVAIKVIYPNLVADISMFQRFVNEVNVGKSILHENVVRTLGAGMAIHDRGESVYMVMEYVAGQTLGEIRRERGRLPEAMCRRIAREVGRALRGIHAAGVVHRDLKPDNVLITPDGVVKVMDLGVALLMQEALRGSGSREFAGSMLYAAPEQFDTDAGEMDARVDLYALGVTLYELASGIQPFAAEDFHQILSKQLTHVPLPLNDVDPALSLFFSEVVARLMEKDPAQRIRSADELFSILSQAEQSRWWRRRSARMGSEDRQPVRRMEITRRTDLAGREREMHQLTKKFAAVREGRGHAVVLVGEAGVGKSRLVDELAGLLELEGEDLDFFFGRHTGLGEGPSHEALLDALKSHYGSEALVSLVEENDDPVDAAVRGMLEGFPPTNDVAREAGARLVELLCQVIEGAAEERPVLLLLDDLHEASAFGQTLFFDLARRFLDRPVLVLGTTRQRIGAGFRGRLAEVPRAEWVELGRLDADAMGRVLAEALGSGMPDPALLQEVHHQSGGNPYFALEVLQSIRERHLIRQTPAGTWSSVRPMAELDLPETLRRTFAERLRGLREDEREMLAAAACVGDRFAPAIVAAVLEREVRAVARTFARLGRDRKLIRRDADTFVFDQQALRRLLYFELPDLTRAHFHGAIADELENAAGETPDGAASAEIARNLLRSDEPERAEPYLGAAFHHLHAAKQYPELIALARGALESAGVLAGTDRLKALAFHALALTARDRSGAALEKLEELIGLLEGDGTSVS